MTIATPIITDFDKENIAPWAGNRLIDLSMATLPSKPFARFFPWNKNALNLGYQKLRPRYEPMDETTKTACEPLCPEGWYFDCVTETCKEYKSYFVDINSLEGFITINRMWKSTTGQIAVNAKYNASNRMCINWLNGGIRNQILEPFWSEFCGGIFEGATYSHNSSLANSFGFSQPNSNYINIVTAFIHDTHGYVLLEEYMQSGSDELFGSSFPLSYEVNNDAVIDIEVKITGKVYGVK